MRYYQKLLTEAFTIPVTANDADGNPYGMLLDGAAGIRVTVYAHGEGESIASDFAMDCILLHPTLGVWAFAPDFTFSAGTSGAAVSRDFTIATGGGFRVLFVNPASASFPASGVTLRVDAQTNLRGQ